MALRLPCGILGGRCRGPDGLRSFTRERYEAWSDVVDELEDLIDAGDAVVSLVVSRGHGRRSGAEAALRHAGGWDIEDGKVVRVVWFASREEGLEAAGLRERPPRDFGA